MAKHFLRKISCVAPPRGTRLRMHYIWDRGEKNPSAQRDSNRRQGVCSTTVLQPLPIGGVTCRGNCKREKNQPWQVGRGGGASGRAAAFCPSEPGSNPGTGLAFFRECCQSILTGRQAISKEWVIKNGTYSSFFFPVSYHLNIVNVSIVSMN